MLPLFVLIRRYSGECMLGVAVLSSTLYSACSGDSSSRAFSLTVVDGGGDASAGGGENGAGGAAGAPTGTGGKTAAGGSESTDSGKPSSTGGDTSSGGAPSSEAGVDSGAGGSMDASDDAMTSNTG